MKSKLNLMINVGSYEGLLLGFEGNLKNLENQYAFSASLGSILCAYHSSRFLMIGGYEEMIKIYDIKKKREVGLLDGHTGTVTAITGYQNFIVSGSEDCKIKIWKTHDWALLQTLELDKAILDINIHKSGRLMISVTKDSRIQLWNLLTMKCIYQRKFDMLISKIKFMDSIANNDDIPYLIILGLNQICLVDSETNKICNSIQFKKSLTDLIIFEQYIIVSDQSGYVYLVKIDKDSKKILLSFRAHQSRVKQMDIIKSQNSIILTTISTNGEINLWDLQNFLNDNEVEDVIELEDKVMPLNVIKTTSRLTCLCVHETFQSGQEEETLQQQVQQQHHEQKKKLQKSQISKKQQEKPQQVRSKNQDIIKSKKKILKQKLKKKNTIVKTKVIQEK